MLVGACIVDTRALVVFTGATLGLNVYPKQFIVDDTWQVVYRWSIYNSMHGSFCACACTPYTHPMSWVWFGLSLSSLTAADGPGPGPAAQHGCIIH
eukprot:6455237-Amphidinium_carterae.1